MKVLVTGAKGFIGQNLLASLRAIGDGSDKIRQIAGLDHPSSLEIYGYDIDNTVDELDVYCRDCDFVFNLAGVNRPLTDSAFMDGNFGFAATLLDTLKKHDNRCPVMLSSSIQAALNNPYGQSKKAGEELFRAYSRETGARVIIYRFPNVFGKWCRPNYNSVIATFCDNIARNKPIVINDVNTELDLVYIDDLVASLIDCLNGQEVYHDDFATVPTVYHRRLGEIAELLSYFKATRTNLQLPKVDDDFTRKLYATYLTYLPADEFAYALLSHKDDRGSFTEMLKTDDRGQIGINICKPGITKGNHWHHTKNEKFLVVSGEARIKFRKVGTEEVYEYTVSGTKLVVVDIPCGYTHSITNIGGNDLVTVMWASEVFDPQQPDTYYLEV